VSKLTERHKIAKGVWRDRIMPILLRVLDCMFGTRGN